MQIAAGAVQARRTHSPERQSAIRPRLGLALKERAEPRDLKSHALEMEDGLRALAARHRGVSFSAISVDKSRQSAINKLGGEKAAGDCVIQAHLDIQDRATALLGAVGKDTMGFNDRANHASDENRGAHGGRDLPADMGRAFGRALWQARRHTDLRDYRYTLIAPHGGGEEFMLDLYSFSKVLRYAEMCMACKYSVSRPRPVSPEEPRGFIMDELRRLDDGEIGFFRFLPEPFRSVGPGTAEVRSPFLASLSDFGIAEMDRGVYVDIKLAADGLGLLPFTKDTELWLGTRKGFAEMYSGQFGVRGLNTVIGKTRANGVLGPVIQAMKELDAAGICTLPVNGSHLRYWTDLPEGGNAEELVRKAVDRRLSEAGMSGFRAAATVLDARGVDIADTRALFILKSLEAEHLAPEVLDLSDFVLNFVENIHPIVQGHILGRLGEEGLLGAADRRNMRALSEVCATRRTVRDTEDFLWVLRRDETLPGRIASRRRELENWLFEFSAEKGGRMFRMLAESISAIGRRK